MRRREVLKAIPLLMAPAVARAETRPLRFIPNANLSAMIPSGPQRWCTGAWLSGVRYAVWN